MGRWIWIYIIKMIIIQIQKTKKEDDTRIRVHRCRRGEKKGNSPRKLPANGGGHPECVG